MALLTKFVSKQYLDNTQNEDRILESYFINDLRVNYKFSLGNTSQIELKLLINNLFSENYSSNGYMYGSTPYYYPQAPRNFLFGLSIGL
jgi:iron complex outermembrane receptor protein